MNVLKQYFDAVKSFRAAARRETISKRRIYYKEIVNQLERAQLYEIAVLKTEEFAKKIHERYKEKERFEAGNSFSLSNLELPASAVFIALDNDSYYFPDNHIKGLFISKTNVSLLCEVKLPSGEFTVSMFTYISDNKWTELADTAERSNEAIKFSVMMMILSVIMVINSYETITVNRINYQKKVKQMKNIKDIKIPLKYHIVNLSSSIINNSIKIDGLIKRVVEKSYAYDVRGHYKCHIKTGELPIDPEIEKRLRKDPRRKIFMNPSEMDDDSREILTKREYEIKEGYWYSVLKTYYHGFIANSKGGKNPYIPSIRVCK